MYKLFGIVHYQYAGLKQVEVLFCSNIESSSDFSETKCHNKKERLLQTLAWCFAGICF